MAFGFVLLIFIAASEIISLQSNTRKAIDHHCKISTLSLFSRENYSMTAPLLMKIALCSAFAAGISGFSPTVSLPSITTAPTTYQESLSPSRLDMTAEVSRQGSPEEDEDEDDCSVHVGPATVFGRPIDEATKRRNRELIHHCKSFLFDNLFGGRSVSRAYARFYALENIARMPYFSYLSVLHLYESLGWWSRADYLKVHFSESWNEQHYPLIMEQMGGSSRWMDRFVAQHVAVFYYWIVVALYMANPTFAYNLNQAVEEEAYQTYDNFLSSQGEFLKSQPAPSVAKEYYTGDDLYLFDAMHYDESGARGTRRPKMETLYDTFLAIRDDELEHVKTMAYLQDDACQ